MAIKRKKIFLWIKILIIIYCGGGISLYYLQTTFLFHPEKLEQDHTFQFDIPFKEINIPVNKTDTINLVKFLPADSIPKGVVLYFHGNMKNVQYYGVFAKALTKYGYEVWMPDYPGYGKSTGERTEKKLYDQAWLVQKLAERSFKDSQIVIYGKSLGTGIAAYAASVSNCRQLILETPYYSVTDMFSHYAWMYPVSLMIKFKIPTWKFLEEVKAPVIMFHGTDDKIIPYSCAAKLKKSLKKEDRFITVEGGEHNDIGEAEVYKHTMDSLMKE